MCALTLLAVVALVVREADADTLDTLSMVGTGWVNALVYWDAAFWSLPALMAYAPTFSIFTIAAAQHRACVCK